MLTEMQVKRIKSYVESMLVCEGQVINASNRLLDAELKVEMESEVKYIEEILRLYQLNAEALGEQFLIYLDSLVDKSKTKDEGWIEWAGGESPVCDNSLVEVKFRNGSKGKDVACWLDWSFVFEEEYAHIIAYRVVADEDQDCPECQEIQQRKDNLRKGIEKSIADLMLSSRRRLAVELPELTEEDKENRILRVNLVVKP